MGSVSTALLQSVAAELARVPVGASDLPSIAGQLGGQLDGLARLDDLELLGVEPATMILAAPEAPHGRS